MRVVLAVIAAILAVVFGVPVCANATVPAASATSIYTFATHECADPTDRSVPERGPPSITYDFAAPQVAVGPRSHGSSVRLLAIAADAYTTYNALTALAPADSNTSTTQRTAQAVDGDLRASPAARVAANSGRGLGDLGGVISQTGRNGVGGRIFTSNGPINQNDFAGIVNNGIMRGDDVHILTGAHGFPNGTMVADASMYADDVAKFGDMPGVSVHNVASMSPEAIRGVMQRPGTIIGGFCDSTACLGAFQ